VNDMLSFGATWTGRVKAVITAIAGVVGGILGYRAAGLGGSVLFACVLAVGGIILGSLVAKTALLFQRAWIPCLIGLGLAALTVVTWGVRF
jgi:hypothetical protein